MAPPPPELVIFDCDGVLVDSEPISNRVLARVLTRYGLAVSAEEALREYKGLLLRDLIAKVEGQLGAQLPAEFVDEFESEREVEFRAGLAPVPGAREVVQRVRSAGCKACVASQGKLAKTDLTLTLTGLRDLFADDELFSAHTVARGKPHPDLFLHAAQSMAADPSLCTVVEDTSLGVRAALSAGMRPLWYVAAANGDRLEGAEVERVHDLAEVPARLGIN